MDKQLFRKKSLDQISSPEQLNDYIRVSNPRMWMSLAALIILLLGVCAWGVLGKLETKITVCAVVENGAALCYVPEDSNYAVTAGMQARIGGAEYEIAAVAASPSAVDAQLGEYALHVGGLQVGEWVYEATLSCDLPDGVYAAEIVVEEIAPMSFVAN